MTSRGQCPGGGGACGYLCKISGKSTPLPPLTKAFPYAYGKRYSKGFYRHRRRSVVLRPYELSRITHVYLCIIYFGQYSTDR